MTHSNQTVTQINEKFYRTHPDPIVELLLNTPVDNEIAYRALVESEFTNNPKVRAMLSIIGAELGICSYTEAIQHAEEAYHKPSHVDLHLLYLAVWYSMLLDLEKIPLAQIKSLEACMNVLVSKQTPPEILGVIRFAKSLTRGLVGDYRGKLELLYNLLEHIPIASPYYNKLNSVRTISFLCHGMGTVVEKEQQLPRIEFDRTGFLVAELSNFALTGQYQPALELLSSFAPSTNTKHIRMGRAQFYSAFALLQLICQTKGIIIPYFPSSEFSEPPSWVSSTQALLNGKFEDALDLARHHAEETQDSYHWQADFVDRTLVRAELATGNARAAKRLLLNFHETGNETYLDQFYFARAERLLGNIDLARQHFSKVLEEIKQYKAQPRFDFEVRIALELSTKDLLDLSATNASSLPTKLSTLSMIKPKSQTGLNAIISSSESMTVVKQNIKSFADLDLPVLISGETGTGKELIARALHEESSRASKPFIAINCAALTDPLIESELFGYSRGAFTGASNSYNGIFKDAGHGTVFLDEISEISPKLQASLLRVLETGEVRPVGSSKIYKATCRIVSAVNQDLLNLVKLGKFREDLFFRLHRLPLIVPPLRFRKDDIPILADYFFNAGRTEKVRLTPRLREKLLEYTWPGNVRELRNTIERMRVLSSDKNQYDLSDWSLHSPNKFSEDLPVSATLTSQLSLNHNKITTALSEGKTPFRRLSLLRELFEDLGRLKVSEAAKIIGISKRTATRYMQSLCKEGLIEKITPTRSPQSHYYAKRQINQN